MESIENKPGEIMPYNPNDGIPRVEMISTKNAVIPNNTDSLLTVAGESGELLRFENNGNIFVHGKLVENDREVVEAFREFFKIK